MRKNPTDDVQAFVLVTSRRRCALCFGLRGDMQEKRNGQLAHVDRDATNSSTDNLVFLCLEHHDEYDTRHSQSKGFTPKELLHYRTVLYKYLEDWCSTALSSKPVRSHETAPFMTLFSPSVNNGVLELSLQNDGAPVNVLGFETKTPGCHVRQWYPPSLPSGALLHAPTDLPNGQSTECIFQMRVRDRTGTERFFQVTVDPRRSPAAYDFIEFS